MSIVAIVVLIQQCLNFLFRKLKKCDFRRQGQNLVCYGGPLVCHQESLKAISIMLCFESKRIFILPSLFLNIFDVYIHIYVGNTS